MTQPLVGSASFSPASLHRQPSLHGLATFVPQLKWAWAPQARHLPGPPQAHLLVHMAPAAALGPPRPHTVLTIIWATSSTFREKWKELACELLQMAWQTMHTLWTRHSLRAGSWRDSGLQEAASATPAWFCSEVVATASWPTGLSPELGAAHGSRGQTTRPSLSSARNTLPSALKGPSQSSCSRQSHRDQCGAEMVP